MFGLFMIRLSCPASQFLFLISSIFQVSYEYIACQQARQGVMILSEFAGAAQSLHGSIVVNPWDSQQVADAIHEAVAMDASIRAENHRKLFKYVNKYSAAFWGSSFIKEMSKTTADAEDGMKGQATQAVKFNDEAGAGNVILDCSVPNTAIA